MVGSLRRQLISLLVIFALTLGVLFGLVTWWVYHRVEDRLVQRRLELMLEPRGRQPRASLSYAGTLKAVPAPYTGHFDDLPPGFYEWEEGDDRETHILLIDGTSVDSSNADLLADGERRAEDAAGGHRIAILSFSESEATQDRVAWALLAGVAATTLVALVLARYLALRLVSPIERLTDQLANQELDAPLPEDLLGAHRQDEIGLLARALQHAGQKLTASARRERRFLREASHELRTPITIIQGVSDLLRDTVDQEDTLTRQRLQRLDRSLRRMHTSVLSLLAMARAEHRVMVTDMPPFRHQLDDLIDEARTIAVSGVEVSVRLTGEPDSPVTASMLIVVLSNLTRNAVQQSFSGKVEVEVTARRATVRDAGPGLPPALLDQLCSDGPRPDIGIGLATVERICQRLGWGLAFNCPSEGGTVVTVELSETQPLANG